jgi:hypothetical protein
VAEERPTCGQILRGGGRCPAPQHALIHWPGTDPLPCCERHTAWARKVAEMLGFTLLATVTHAADPDADDAALRFSLLELDE